VDHLRPPEFDHSVFATPALWHRTTLPNISAANYLFIIRCVVMNNILQDILMK